MKDCPGKLMGSWKNSSFLIISSWWQPVPCKRAAYFPLMQRRTLRCLEVFLFTLRVSFWTSNYSASFFSLTESSLRSKVLFLFSSFLACSWQTRTGLLQQKPQHFVKDFSAPRKTTYFHPSHPLDEFWLHPENWSSVSIQGSRNLPRTCPAPDLTSDLKSHVNQLPHSILGLWL